MPDRLKKGNELIDDEEDEMMCSSYEKINSLNESIENTKPNESKMTINVSIDGN